MFTAIGLFLKGAIPKIFSFIVKHWKIIVPVLIILFVWWKFNQLNETIKEQNEVIQKQTQVIGLQQQNIERLVGVVSTVNSALSEVSKTSEEVKKQFDGLRSSINTQVGSVNKRLDNVLNEKKPETCEQSMQYLLDARKEMRK